MKQQLQHRRVMSAAVATVVASLSLGATAQQIEETVVTAQKRAERF